MAINDPLICTQHEHFQDALRDMKNEIKEEFKSIHESIGRLSDMFSEIAIGKNDRELIRKSLDEIFKEYREIKIVIHELHIEKEQILANSKIEHLSMRKDIDAAHEVIRNIMQEQERHFTELKNNQDAMMKEVRKIMVFRKTFLWIGAGISGILGAAVANTLSVWVQYLFGGK